MTFRNIERIIEHMDHPEEFPYADHRPVPHDLYYHIEDGAPVLDKP